MSALEPPLLVLVPARGGSKGIPRKVLQPVAGVPLLLRTLRTARESGVAQRIVVSTEDSEIASIARLHGFEVLDRPARHATDTATIKHVVRHALEALAWHGSLLVMQPTCPLLRPQTVRAFVDEFRGPAAFDWAISGYRPGHLYWQSPMGTAFPHPLTRRTNRQHAVDSPDAVWQESGALQIWRGGDHSILSRGLIPIPAAEALDIDTHADLFAAERALGRRTIGFRVTVGQAVGTGHFWRCLRLSEALAHHSISWRFVGTPPTWATDLLDQRGIRWWGWDEHPNLVVVDALDAAESIVPHAKAYGSKVVLFEHEGPATRFADLVVDEFADPKWVVLRPEFLCLPEHRPEPWQRHRILITFGGTDPSGLSARFGPLLRSFADVRLIQGPGAAPVKPPSGVEIVTGACMAEEMRWADLVVTSQGRTVTEAVACGTPVVSIAANERESRHVRIPGVLYLGLHAALSDSTVAETVGRLLNGPNLRAEMAATASAQVDGLGVRRIVRRIDDLLEGL